MRRPGDAAGDTDCFADAAEGREGRRAEGRVEEDPVPITAAKSKSLEPGSMVGLLLMDIHHHAANKHVDN